MTDQELITRLIELTDAGLAFRPAVREIQRTHPEVKYSTAYLRLGQLGYQIVTRIVRREER